MIYLTAFAASLSFVFLKAFQQRNVAFGNYFWVMPTSMAMAATEVLVVASVARFGWDFRLVAAIGLGAGLGAITAMYLHERFVRGKGKGKG